MKFSSLLLLSGTALTVVAGAAVGFKLYQSYEAAPQPGPTLAAGTPLPPTSSSQITVLPGQDGTPGTTLTSSNQLLASTSSITLPPAPAETPAKDAVFDPTAARLGTTISLLMNAWPNGGPLPRQLAAAAATLAEQSGQPALVNAANALRSSTPREGPLTLQVLLLEASAVVNLPPPENLPQTDVQAEAEKSWFRKQLENLIHISSVPSTQNRWVTAILTVQQQLVRGAVNDAAAALESAPLEADPRLEPLRQVVRDYLSQTGKLTNLVTAYTNTYLTARDQD